jgi:predicted RNase H-like HicB family nuclease
MLDLVTEGDTREEAIAMARVCAEALILTYFDLGDKIPDEGGQAEIATIEVDLQDLSVRLAAEKAAAVAS